MGVFPAKLSFLS